MKKLVMFLAATCFAFLSSFMLSAAAAAESAAPRIYGEEVSAQQGGAAYMDIAAENFQNVGSMEVTLLYDASAFSVGEVSVSGLNAGNMCTYNDDGQGALVLAAISSAEGGVSGSGDLWRVRFDVAEDAAPDTYNVVVAVGEVANVDLSDIAVESGNGKIEVREKDVPVQTMYIYSSVSYPSAGGAYEGEEISVSFRTYNACGLAAAEFEIGYDDSRLTLEEVALGSALVSAEGALSDINDDVDGYIKIAYACTRGISGTADPLVTCRFTVSGNEAGSVPVTFAPGGLYDGDRNPVRADAVQVNAETLYREPVIDPPDISVESRENVCGEFRVDVLAEGESGLAAAGILVEFDPAALECVAIEGATGNPDYDTGKARFSFLNADGISEDTVLGTLVFRPLVSSGSTALTVSAQKPVDSESNDLELEYVPGSVSFAEHAWGEWGLAGSGAAVERGCGNCGEVQTISVSGEATLTLEDEVKVNYRVGITKPEGVSADVSAQVLVYESADAQTAETLDMVYEEASGDYVAANARTYAAKEIGDSHWIRFSITVNGVAIESGRIEYSPKIYAMNMLSKGDGFGEIDDLALAMLDYAAAAQSYFGYKTDAPANADVTAEMRAAAEAYRAEVYTQNTPYVPQEFPWIPSPSYAVSMTLNLDGKVSINGYLTAGEGQTVQMAVFASEADAEKGLGGAAEVVDMQPVGGGRYKGTAEATKFAAKEFGDDVYLVFYVGGEAVTPAVRYGVAVYAYNKLTDADAGEDIRALCEAMLHYAAAAQMYFDYKTDALANAGLKSINNEEA